MCEESTESIAGWFPPRRTGPPSMGLRVPLRLQPIARPATRSNHTNLDTDRRRNRQLQFADEDPQRSDKMAQRVRSHRSDILPSVRRPRQSRFDSYTLTDL